MLRKLLKDFMEGLGQAGAAFHGLPPLTQEFEPAALKTPAKEADDPFTIVKYGTVSAIKEAIDAGLDLTQKNAKGETLMMAACGNMAHANGIVDLLVEKGADKTGALSYAIRCSALDAATHLMNNHGQTPDFSDTALKTALGVANYEANFDFCLAVGAKQKTAQASAPALKK